MLERKLNTVREDLKNMISEEKLKELSLFSLSEEKKPAAYNAVFLPVIHVLERKAVNCFPHSEGIEEAALQQ